MYSIGAGRRGQGLITSNTSRCCGAYLFLNSEQGVQISRLVFAVLKMETAGREMMRSHLMPPVPVNTTPTSLRVKLRGLASPYNAVAEDDIMSENISNC
jgi:hypothetical protein